MCSGKEFLPYTLKNLLRWKATPADPVLTTFDVQPLIQVAMANEDQCFKSRANNFEGVGVSSRPISPLTELESEDGLELPNQPLRNFGPGTAHVEKKRRNAAAHVHHAKKRVKAAASGHGPHTYAASPSTATHHSEDLPPLQVPVDAGSFSASGSGSWTGKCKKGTKKAPWTLPELLKEDFAIVEWDGW